MASPLWSPTVTQTTAAPVPRTLPLPPPCPRSKTARWILTRCPRWPCWTRCLPWRRVQVLVLAPQANRYAAAAAAAAELAHSTRPHAGAWCLVGAQAFTFGAKDRKRDPARGRAESTARVDARQVESDRRRGVWEDYKAGVLRAHNVAGKIRVTASFLSDVSNQDEQTPVAMDRARARLEALEKTEEDSSVEMSDKEILSSVEKHRRDLVGAWTRAERVRSLKISIQVAKLLLETSVPQFYPLLFVHVTDILDTFGDLVFKRIFKRAQQAQAKIDSSKRITCASSRAACVVGRPQSLTRVLRVWRGPNRTAASFTSADISSDAKETCRNWIYKTACIRELLPRLCVLVAVVAAVLSPSSHTSRACGCAVCCLAQVCGDVAPAVLPLPVGRRVPRHRGAVVQLHPWHRRCDGGSIRTGLPG